MLNQSHHPRSGQGGVSLVELMVGMVVGLIVMAALLAVYIITTTGATDTVRAARLNQDLRIAMSFMASDIRRAGYWSGMGTPGANCYTNRTANTDCPGSAGAAPAIGDIFISDGPDLVADFDCILVSYDATYDLDPRQVVFGYRKTSDGMGIEMLYDLTGTLTSTNGCSSTATGLWQPLTDADETRVTGLNISTAGSRCFNVTTNTSGTPVGAGVSTPACENMSPTPGADDRLYENRIIRVNLTGVHRGDERIMVQLTQDIKVNNNRIVN